MLARSFLDVSFHGIRLALVAALPQHLTIAHCFKTLDSDRLFGCRFMDNLCSNVCWLAGLISGAENVSYFWCQDSDLGAILAPWETKGVAGKDGHVGGLESNFL